MAAGLPWWPAHRRHEPSLRSLPRGAYRCAPPPRQNYRTSVVPRGRPMAQMSRQAVADAQAIARRLNHNEVETWHLLSALLGQENGIIPGLVDKMGLSAGALQLAVDRELERLPKVTGSVDTSKVY